MNRLPLPVTSHDHEPPKDEIIHHNGMMEMYGCTTVFAVGAFGIAPSNQKQVQQTCLNNFNNTVVGKVTNFFSLASPFIGPDPIQSAIEDVGGTAAKYAAYRGLQYLANSPALLGGSNAQFVLAVGSGAVAEGIHAVAADVVAPVAAVATGLQLAVHAACYGYSNPSVQPYLPPTF